MKNDLFYDNMSSDLRSEIVLGAEQYRDQEVSTGVVKPTTLPAQHPKSYNKTVAEIAEEFNKDLERMGYMDAIELYGGR